MPMSSSHLTYHQSCSGQIVFPEATRTARANPIGAWSDECVSRKEALFEASNGGSYDPKASFVLLFCRVPLTQPTKEGCRFFPMEIH